ncbi:MAG: glycosyltransferase [Pseudomonadota bacterium]
MKTKNDSPLIRVFIGYDRRAPILFHVLSHSIMRHASRPVTITPLVLPHFEGLLKRGINENQSTEFSFSRFLTPYLSGYEGWSLFVDNDMVFLDDIATLWAMRDERYAVQVVKHTHQPKEATKFLGEKQTSYEKKNWSSVMLFNNARCRALTPEFVSTASGLQLHQFKWLESDNEIGDIPHRWNHLVDYDPEVPLSEVSNLHYTLGGPYYTAYQDCAYADAWTDARDAMLAVEERKLK